MRPDALTPSTRTPCSGQQSRRSVARSSRRPDAQVEVTPARLDAADLVAVGRGVVAQRAAKPAAAQRHLDHYSIRLENDLPDVHPGKAQQARECSVTRTVKDPRLVGLNTREPRVRTRARRPPLRATPRKHGRTPATTAKPARAQARNHLHRVQEPQLLLG